MRLLVQYQQIIVFKFYNQLIRQIMDNFEQNQTVQFKPKKKLSIPAIIFNRTPRKQRHNNLALHIKSNTPLVYNKSENPALGYKMSLINMIQDNDQEPWDLGKQNFQCISNKDTCLSEKKQIYKCVNHANKIGKYQIIIQGQDYIYCQKCAILLASQGFKVQKIEKQKPIDKGELYEKRRSQIQNLLVDINQGISHLQNKKQETQEILEKQEQITTQQINKIDQYFQSLHSIIEEHKTQYYNMILQEKQSSQSICTQLAELLDDSLGQMNKMKNDLENINKPIQKIDQKQFRPVMEFYKMKIRNFNNIPKQWLKEEIQIKKIQFVQIMEISKVLQNLFGLNSNVQESLDFDFQKKHQVNQTSSSKKLKGVNTSIYFSFDGQSNNINQNVPVYTIPQEQNLIQEEIQQKSSIELYNYSSQLQNEQLQQETQNIYIQE